MDFDLEKYKLAGRKTADILDMVVKKIVVGANVVDLCKYGDSLNKSMCFPTTISVNNIVSNFTSSYILKEGDLVKIELGSHVDNYPSMICYSMVVGPNITKEQKELLKTISRASRKVLKLMTPDNTNIEVIDVLNKICNKHKYSLPYVNDLSVLEMAPGVSSFQISRGVLVGMNEEKPGMKEEMIHKQILNNYKEHYPYNMVEGYFEPGEVYTIDIVFSTGNGLLQPDVSNIYSRNIDSNKYNLKLSTSRVAYKQTKMFPTNINNSLKKEDIVKYKMGIKECLKHKLVNSYPVFTEKSGVLTARVKFTVVITNDEPELITGRAIDCVNKNVV